MPEAESGVVIYGDPRVSAVGDFDADGRPDLLVAENGAATKLFHTRRDTPGIRVRLKGV